VERRRALQGGRGRSHVLQLPGLPVRLRDLAAPLEAGKERRWLRHRPVPLLAACAQPLPWMLHLEQQPSGCTGAARPVA
jgi:hypothetical protein